jgi:hypothetical protein
MTAKQILRGWGLLRRGAWALTLGTAVLASGCKMLDVNEDPKPKAPQPPMGKAVGVQAYWQSQIFMVPDPVHNGEPTPGLVGRVMLFGENQDMLCCEGTVTVRLYDDNPADGGPPREIERWNIDKDSFKKLANRDLFGWGYTLFLPTDRCNPSVTKVHLAVQFTPENSNIPVYSAQSPVRLSYNDNGFGAGNTMTGSYRPPQTQPPRPGAAMDMAPPTYQRGPVQQNTGPIITPAALQQMQQYQQMQGQGQPGMQVPAAPTPVQPMPPMPPGAMAPGQVQPMAPGQVQLLPGGMAPGQVQMPPGQPYAGPQVYPPQNYGPQVYPPQNYGPQSSPQPYYGPANNVQQPNYQQGYGQPAYNQPAYGQPSYGQQPPPQGPVVYPPH